MARRAVTAAHEALDHGHHDDLLEIGGEFLLSQASHHHFGGAAGVGPQRRTRSELARTELAAPVFCGSAQARELDERIEEFGRDSVTASPHAVPGGPS